MAALDFPDAPTNGQIYDKWTWNGTQWVLTAGGQPGGTREILRQTNAATGSIGSGIQTIFTLPLTAVTGRRYRFRSQMQFSMGGSVGTVTASITDAGGVTLNSSQQSSSAGFVGNIMVEYEVVPPAGFANWLVRIVANATCSMNGAATQVHWATIDEIAT